MRIPLRVSILLSLFTCCILPSYLTAAVDSTIEQALLAEDWAAAHALLEQEDLGSDSLAWFLYDNCCFVLDLECATMSPTTHPDELWRHQATIDWIQRLAESNKENAAAAFLTGALRLRQGHPDYALGALEHALRKNPKFVPALVLRGLIQAEDASFARIRNTFQRALGYDPDYGFALLTYGAILDQNGKYEMALEKYETGLSTGRHTAEFEFNRGNTFRHMGENRKAIDAYTAALAADSTMVAARYDRGNAYRDEEKIDSAMADYEFVAERADGRMREVAFTLPPLIESLADSVQFYKDIAALREVDRCAELFGKGLLDQAIASCTKAVAEDSTVSDGYYWRAAAYEYRGDLDSAIADYSRALELHPTDTTAWYHRGLCYSYSHDYVAAQASISRAIELNPEFINAYRERGWAYDMLKDYDRALADYETHTSLLRESGDELGRDDGMIAKLRNRPEGANDYYARSLVEDVYRTVAEQQWEKLAGCANRKLLEDFKEAAVPVLVNQDADPEQYVIIGGKIVKPKWFKDKPPELTVPLIFELLHATAKHDDSTYAIEHSEVLGAREIGDDEFLVRSRLIVVDHGQRRQMIRMDVVSRYDRRWVLESLSSLPTVFAPGLLSKRSR